MSPSGRVRWHKWKMTRGYTVMAIPRCGLFVKNGELITGDSGIVNSGELILFSRESEASAHRDRCKANNAKKDCTDPICDFMVFAVLVREKD